MRATGQTIGTIVGAHNTFHIGFGDQGFESRQLGFLSPSPPGIPEDIDVGGPES